MSSAAAVPADPIRVSKGNAYADIGLVGTFAAGGSTASDIEGPGGIEPGGHDPNQRGFTVQGVEMNIQGAVDPYFRGNANILFGIDSGGEVQNTVYPLFVKELEIAQLFLNLITRIGQQDVVAVLVENGHDPVEHRGKGAEVDPG